MSNYFNYLAARSTNNARLPPQFFAGLTVIKEKEEKKSKKN